MSAFFILGTTIAIGKGLLGLWQESLIAAAFAAVGLLGVRKTIIKAFLLLCLFVPVSHAQSSLDAFPSQESSLADWDLQIPHRSGMSRLVSSIGRREKNWLSMISADKGPSSRSRRDPGGGSLPLKGIFFW